LVLGVVGLPAAVIRAVRGSENDGLPTKRQLAIAEDVAQVLIPRNDTPGGADVGAHDFLVLALAHGLDGTRAPEGGAAIQGANTIYRRTDGSLDYLSWLEDALDRGAHGDYLAAPLARRQAALDVVDRAAFANHQASGPWAKIKGLLLTGYYTSEAGGSKELRYELVPGRFDPDLPLGPQDRAWSSDWTAVEFG
jgi:hypothetical protein